MIWDNVTTTVRYNHEPDDDYDAVARAVVDGVEYTGHGWSATSADEARERAEADLRAQAVRIIGSATATEDNGRLIAEIRIWGSTQVHISREFPRTGRGVGEAHRWIAETVREITLADGTNPWLGPHHPVPGLWETFRDVWGPWPLLGAP